MNRPKFRAWDKQNGCWYQPVHEAYKGNLHELLICFAGELGAHTMNGMKHESLFPDRYVLVQFTGLFDDTGKQIYEGDIVRVQDHFETKTSYVSQVYFTPDYGTFMEAHPAHKKMGHADIRHLRHFCSYGMSEETTCDCVVIGNVYENPELITDAA